MRPPSLFIGVVSHVGTRFSASQGTQGLGYSLAAQLQPEFATVVRVITENLHDGASLPITSAIIQDSLTAQERLENEWRRYLRNGRRPSIRENIASVLRWGRRRWRRLARPSARGITRLINIELAHAALLREGIDSGAPWILILEDDAFSPDIQDCARGLRGLMDEAAAGLSYINVSESFSLTELGIEPLLAPTGVAWAGNISRSVMSCSRPATNTVCAILYRASFASALLEEFASMPMTPVVPIDWKLNAALMHMHDQGLLGPDSCWFVAPAPIDQQSMRAP